jgi:hypothetical protein
MTAPTGEPAADNARDIRELQLINLLSRLDSALAALAPDGELARRLDHLDELAHTAGQRLEALGTDLSKVTGKLDEFDPLLERAKAMLNPGAVASTWVAGRRRGPKHRGDQT